MKVTPRLPMHLPGVDPQEFPELRYFRFGQQSAWAAAIFGLFEELRLPRFQSHRLRLLSYIRENPHIQRKEVLCFLLDPKTNAENMLAAWNYGFELIPLVIEAAMVVTGTTSAALEDILRAIHAIPIIMQSSEQPLPADRSSPAIYVRYHGTDWAALLYAYHAPGSYSVTDCGHIALKATLFADARRSMQKPLCEKEMDPHLVRCRKCREPIGKGIFALGKKDAQMYPPDLPGRLFSHFTARTELPDKTVGTKCAYCKAKRGSFTCFGGCKICAKCAMLASCSQVYYLRCPACGCRFGKEDCSFIMEELPKNCSWEMQVFQNSLDCDRCHRYFSLADVEETTHFGQKLLTCRSFDCMATAEETKERGCQCANCRNIKHIKEFKFYLSNKHRCLLCDTCYYQFLLTRTLSRCPGCSEAFTSQDRKNYSAVIERTELPNIYCDVCGQQHHEREFSEGIKLSHWWKCRVCNASLSTYQRVGYQVCGACMSPYTADDKAAIERLFNKQASNTPAVRVTATLKCELCQRPLNNFSIKDSGKHRCKVCDECWEAVIDSYWNCTCPVCDALIVAPSLQKLQEWREPRNSFKKMSDLATCLLCRLTKPRKEMLKKDQLHHSCVICDACLISFQSFAACPVCAAPYQGVDLTISVKLIPKKCFDCQRIIGNLKPKCRKACVCSMCLLKNYALTKNTKCYKCNSQLEGILPKTMRCCGCLRELTITSDLNDAVSGICVNSCVLCCFCIRIDQSTATCAQCEGYTETHELERIEKLQKYFQLGCYCGKSKGKKLTLDCGHKAHVGCQPSLIACRQCGQAYREKQRSHLLSSYVS